MASLLALHYLCHRADKRSGDPQADSAISMAVGDLLPSLAGLKLPFQVATLDCTKEQTESTYACHCSHTVNVHARDVSLPVFYRVA